MGDLTDNLSRHEFDCECNCGFNTADFELVGALQAACNAFSATLGCKVSITISGGTRCNRHNTELREMHKQSKGRQGAKTALNSQHIYGRAADFKLYKIDKKGEKEQISPEEVAQWFEENYPHFGIGRYNSRTHVDSRATGAARWDVR